MVDGLYDEARREIPLFGINIFDYYRLFPIARLYEFTSSTSIGTRNYYRGVDNAYHEAYLVKVIKVVIKDAVFSPYIPYEGKPLTNKLRIFTEGSLEVINAIKTRLKLWLSLNKVFRLVLPDASAAALRE